MKMCFQTDKDVVDHILDCISKIMNKNRTIHLPIQSTKHYKGNSFYCLQKNARSDSEDITIKLL